MKKADYIEDAAREEQHGKAAEPAGMASATPDIHIPLYSVWNMLRSLDTASKLWLIDRLNDDMQANQTTSQAHALLSDNELAERLKGLPAWDEVEHPDLSVLSREDYIHASKAHTRKPMKGIEKWL